MVSNVAKLTRSLRNSFLRKEDLRQVPSAAMLDHKRNLVHQELRQTGQAIYVDEYGNRYRIEAPKPV